MPTERRSEEVKQSVGAAGALFRDAQGDVLLVRPRSRPGWDIPGGMIEAGESPIQACVREVREELGLAVQMGRLLAHEHVPTCSLGCPLDLFVFDGGVLGDREIAEITLDQTELCDLHWATVGSLPSLLTQSQSRRILRALAYQQEVEVVPWN